MSAPGTSRWTLAFSDPELERLYRSTRSARWRGVTLGSGLLAMSWTALGGWASLVLPGEADLVWRAVGANVLILVLSLVAPRVAPARMQQRAISIAALTGLMLTGFVLIALYLQAGGSLRPYSVAGFAFYLLVSHTFTYGRFGPKLAVTWTLVAVWLIIVGANAGASWPAIVDSAYWILVGQLAGTYVVYTSERQSRRIFVQQRMTERERTRADIAERARHLAEALLRVSGAPARHLEVGAIIEDQYRVVRELGKGGMGAVYEVERVSDGKRLALKVLHGAADREALARFAREAQIAAQLDHPNLVSVVDVDVSQTGTLFLVMELVAGSSLAAQRENFGNTKWARPILRQIAAALVAMHARGIVHRDLKPANVLLDGETAKVADFGIASLGEGPGAAEAGDGAAGHDSTVAADPSLTRTGVFMGTPMYMAPELGRGAREATSACDVFALGIIAYELLSGNAPFAEPPVVARLQGRTPAKPPVLDGELGAIVDRCLSLDPAARPSAQEAGDALRS